MAWRPSALLDAGTSVAVASTTTLLSGPHDVVGGQVCGIALTNQDASQTLEAWVEVSADGATWEAKACDQARCAVELARHLDETDNGKRDFSDRTLAAAVDAELGKA